jgi:RimJ/RimL family protein N-acetyltransferase
VVELKTRRLRLRELRGADWRALHGFLSDPAVIRYTLFPLSTPEWASNFVEYALAEGDKENRESYVLALERLEDERFIGLGGLLIKPDPLQAELWYCLEQPSWGQGYATEAVRALLHYGADELGLHRIWAHVVPDNPASIQVLEKVGMRREGHMREGLLIRGAWHDAYLYAILEREWLAAQASKD